MSIIALCLSLLVLSTPAISQVGLAQAVPATPATNDQARAQPPEVRSGDTDPQLYEAILPEHRDRIYSKTAGRLSRYRITAAVEPDAANGPAAIAGSIDLRYVNETQESLRQIFFRLYPNAPAYTEAMMTVPKVLIAGQPVDTGLSVDDTVLSVSLPEQLNVGSAVDVELEYSAVVPNRPIESYGIFAVDPETGTIALAHWFPVLAGYDEHGWSLDPVSRNGDPIFTNTALFDVRLATPEAWEVAATGVEIESTTHDGATTRRFVSGPARDFTAATSAQFESVSQTVAGTLVTSYFLPEHAAGGQAVLTYASRALAIFSNLLVPYPYRRMSLAEVELYGAGGVEFSQFTFMGSGLYGDDNRRNEHYLEFVTAHEVGHQWFYGLVGSNQHLNAFIDEGLDEYLSTEVYFSIQYGPADGRRQYGLEVLMWYLGALQSRGDVVVDQPTDDFTSTVPYGAAAYAKGAIGFAEIRTLIGDDAFFAALRDYCVEFEFEIATPDDLLQAFEASSDRDVEPVWRYWFEGQHGEEFFGDDTFDELQVELGLR